jgi:hypothetical protein
VVINPELLLQMSPLHQHSAGLPAADAAATGRSPLEPRGNFPAEQPASPIQGCGSGQQMLLKLQPMQSGHSIRERSPVHSIKVLRVDDALHMHTVLVLRRQAFGVRLQQDSTAERHTTLDSLRLPSCCSSSCCSSNDMQRHAAGRVAAMRHCGCRCKSHPTCSTPFFCRCLCPDDPKKRLQHSIEGQGLVLLTCICSCSQG